MERAALQVLDELDSQARQMQHRFPNAILVQNQASLTENRRPWLMDRDQLRFAGQWLFDYGILTP